MNKEDLVMIAIIEDPAPRWSRLTSGANLDTEFDNTYNNVKNLICPEGLSFNTSSSHNGVDDNINNKRVINCIKRINKNYCTVCITATDICDENESKSINNLKIINPEHKRWWLKVQVQINNVKNYGYVC